MPEVITAHTAHLDRDQLQAVRALLDAAFDGDFSDEDFEHCLGGMHALIWDDDGLAGHGAVVQRRLLHDERALRTGYVEGVAVRHDRRRLGYGGALMTALERIIRAGYELGALSSSEQAVDFYLGRGWQLWSGSVSVLAPGGRTPMPEEDGSVYVLPGMAVLQPDGDLGCDWRNGDVW